MAKEPKEKMSTFILMEFKADYQWSLKEDLRISLILNIFGTKYWNGLLKPA